MFHAPERFRLTHGPLATPPGAGHFGAFIVHSHELPRQLTVIASDNEEGWEHVSVSLPDRTPTCDEMCYIKSLFWDEDDLVVQFHPPRSKCPYSLHLWRPRAQSLLVPPAILQQCARPAAATP